MASPQLPASLNLEVTTSLWASRDKVTLTEAFACQATYRIMKLHLLGCHQAPMHKVEWQKHTLLTGVTMRDSMPVLGL